MSTTRETFLQRVQRAMAEGNRAGIAGEIPPRGQVGYQGGGTNLVERFAAELTAAGGQPHLAADPESAIARIIDLVEQMAARKVLLGHGPVVDELPLAGTLQSTGREVIFPEDVPPTGCKEAFFDADVGITGVDYLIAETGSVVQLSRPGEPRSFSLLSPVHVAVARASQVVPDLFDLFEHLAAKPAQASGRRALPSGMAIITGPSKTGDIELRLVTGVHGPGEIHVVVLTDGGE
jgi:L-lactate utilization protein LutC